MKNTFLFIFFLTFYSYPLINSIGSKAPQLTSNILDLVKESDKSELTKLFNLIEEEKVKLRANKENHLFMCEKTLRSCKDKLSDNICNDQSGFVLSELEEKLKETEETFDDAQSNLQKVTSLVENNQIDCKQIQQVFQTNQNKFEDDLQTVNKILGEIKIQDTLIRQEESNRLEREQIAREKQIKQDKIKTEENLAQIISENSKAKEEQVRREEQIKINEIKTQANLNELRKLEKQFSEFRINTTEEMTNKTRILENLKEENIRTGEQIKSDFNISQSLLNNIKNQSEVLKNQSERLMEVFSQQKNETNKTFNSIQESIKSLYEEEKNKILNERNITQEFLKKNLEEQKIKLEENKKIEESVKAEVKKSEENLKSINSTLEKIQKDNLLTINNITTEKNLTLTNINTFKSEAEKLREEIRQNEVRINNSVSKTEEGVKSITEEQKRILFEHQKAEDNLKEQLNKTQTQITLDAQKIKEDNLQTIEKLTNERNATEQNLLKLKQEIKNLDLKNEETKKLIEMLNEKANEIGQNKANNKSFFLQVGKVIKIDPINNSMEQIKVNPNPTNPIDSSPKEVGNNKEEKKPLNSFYFNRISEIQKENLIQTGEKESTGGMFNNVMAKLGSFFHVFSLVQIKETPSNSTASNITSELKVNSTLDFHLASLNDYMAKISYLESSQSELSLVLENLKRGNVELYDSFKDSENQCDLRLKEGKLRQEKLRNTIVETKFEIENLKKKISLNKSQSKLCSFSKENLKVCNDVNDYCNNYQIEYTQEIKELEDLLIYFKKYIDQY